MINNLEVKITWINEDKEDNLKAYCSLLFEKCFKVVDIKIMNGENGLFVIFPQKQKINQETGKTEWVGVAFPITKNAREELIDLILEEYNKEVENDTCDDFDEVDDEDIPFK